MVRRTDRDPGHGDRYDRLGGDGYRALRVGDAQASLPERCMAEGAPEHQVERRQGLLHSG